jgi:hypothetical protein
MSKEMTITDVLKIVESEISKKGSAMYGEGGDFQAAPFWNRLDLWRKPFIGKYHEGQN